MAGEYYMNWTDDTIKAPFVLNLNTKDTSTCSLTLFGKGSPNYGEGLQENILRLLENFCSTTAPATKTIGQIWYDHGSKTIKYWNGTTWDSSGVQVSSTQPAAPTNGQLWLDLSTKEVKFWDSTKWVTLTDKAAFTAHAADASLHMSAAQNALLDGLSSSLTSDEVNRLVGVTSSVQTQLNTEASVRASADTTITNSLNTHVADATVHLTSTQNTWLDGITATATEVNRLSGLTSNAQSQLTTISNNLSTHTADATVHLTAAQNTLIDALTVTAAELNYVDGVTSNIQTQLTNLANSSSTAATHAASTALHLTSAQNTWIDAITATSTEVNYLVGVTSSIQTQLTNLGTADSTHAGNAALHLTVDQNALLDALTVSAVELNYVDGVTSNIQTQLTNLGTADSTHASNMVLHLTSAQNTWLDAITASSTELNYVDGVTSNIQTQLDDRYTKAQADAKTVALIGSTESGTATYLSATQQINTILGKVTSMSMSQDGGATRGSFVCRATGTGDANLAGMTFWNDTYALKLGVRADGMFGLGGWSSGAWMWYVDGIGNMTAARNVTAYSDPRLKENFERIQNPLDLIEKLDGGSFNWKSGVAHTAAMAGERDYGILADQVEAIMPELISNSIEIEGETYKTVAYAKLIPLLLESIKALNEKVKALEAK